MYVNVLHASRIHSGSGAGTLQFQACTSHSKNNFHSVLPCDSVLVGWRGGWWCVLEESRGEKWRSRWMCSNGSDCAVLCRDGLPLILTHTRTSAVWIILTDNGRMRLISHKSLLLHFKRRNRSQAWLATFGVEYVTQRCNLAPYSCVLSFCSEISDVCFMSGGCCLWLGPVQWNGPDWALRTFCCYEVVCFFFPSRRLRLLSTFKKVAVRRFGFFMM